MKVEKGTILKINHQKKGVFLAIANDTFDTEKEDFYPVSLYQDYLKCFAMEYFKGDNIPCRNIFVKKMEVSNE